MNGYKDITFWENERRLEKLVKFHIYVVDYFNDSHKDTFGIHLTEGEKARHSRRKINLMIDEVHKMIIAAGINCDVRWAPPPAVGGYARNVNVLMNLSNLYRFDISPHDAVDFIERAIGVYQSDRRKSVFRTFNPFWWMRRLLYWFARTPFSLIEVAGFDATRAESSTLGRFVKIILILIPVIASLFAILDHVGWLDALKPALGIGS